MNHRLTSAQIRQVCTELLTLNPALSGRSLRKELSFRFGAVGKTERVFAIWREETSKVRTLAEYAALPTDVRELQQRVRSLEATAAQYLRRAELAEYREREHQDHWALEIDRVKRELEAARSVAAGGQGRNSKAFPV